MVVRTLERAVEIQLRTELQHTWAESSEKLSDLVDPGIKYGGGDDDVKEFLTTASKLVTSDEELELKMSELESRLTAMQRTDSTDEDVNKIKDEAFRLRSQMLEAREGTREVFREALAKLQQIKDDAS